MSHWRRLGGALALLLAVLVVGTIGYVVLGFGLLDALYQTVTTVATVGYREVQPLSTAGKIFTMVLILLGVGAALYAFTVLIETLVEGRLQDVLGRRRMERTIGAMRDHVIICGWGRVGRSIAAEVAAAGRDLVVIDQDAARLGRVPAPDDRGRRHRRRRARPRRAWACGRRGRRRRPGRRELVHHAQRAGQPPRRLHREPRPQHRERGQAAPRRRRPGREPAAHRRGAHGRVRAPPARRRVPRRRHARAQPRVPARGARGGPGLDRSRA